MDGTNPVHEGRADAELVARVLAGETEAYSTLVRRHQEALYGYARAMALDADTAADIVQDTLIKAYRKLRACREPARFRAWLFRILRNRCLDHLKDVRRMQLPLDAVHSGRASVGHYDAGVELRLALAPAFNALPAALRDAFLLKHQAGYSYDEIAEIAGCSVSAAKMRVHRARGALRACLIEQEIDPT